MIQMLSIKGLAFGDRSYIQRKPGTKNILYRRPLNVLVHVFPEHVDGCDKRKADGPRGCFSGTLT
jgi:hypothetical protein